MLASAAAFRARRRHEAFWSRMQVEAEKSQPLTNVYKTPFALRVILRCSAAPCQWPVGGVGDVSAELACIPSRAEAPPNRPAPYLLRMSLTNPNDGAPEQSRYGQALFDDMVERFVRPELERRRADGKWSDEEPVYRFQVLLPDGTPPAVRLNKDVGGTVLAKATRPIAAGEEVVIDDFSAISSYTPREEDAGTPHVTGFLHRDGWSLVFEFAGGHPDRFAFLERAQEFLDAARHALGKEHLGACYDNALSACELLAKTELLSCRPTIEIVLNSRTHAAITTHYNLWANLGNTDKRYARLLDRLHARRSTARYMQGAQLLTHSEAEEVLATLTDMHEHVKRRAQEAPSERDDRFNVYATRELRAGELVRSGDFTLAPPRSKSDESPRSS